MENIPLELQQVLPGMITAQPILSDTSEIILQSNVELTSRLIALLRAWKIEPVYVQPVNSTKIQTNRPHTSFMTKYYRICAVVKNIFVYVRNKQKLPYTRLTRVANYAFRILDSDENILTGTYRLSPLIHYDYFHAVNVGLIAGLMGYLCHFTKQTVKSLIMAGILHDIGKTQLQCSLLDKIDLFTVKENKLLPLHPIYGYYMVKSLGEYLPGIEYGIFQHHEREDGSGYPAAIYAHTIHPFAKIIAIADRYDNLTANKIDEKNVTMFDAMEILMNEMFTQLDHEYCKELIGQMFHFLIGAVVLLSDRTLAKILYFSSFLSAKPVVKTNNGMILDLSLIDDVYIAEVVKFS